MNKKITLTITGLFTGIVIAVAGNLFMLSKSYEIRDERLEKIRLMGYEAAQANVPAQANPCKSTEEREQWLFGWIDYQKELHQ